MKDLIYVVFLFVSVAAQDSKIPGLPSSNPAEAISDNVNKIEGLPSSNPAEAISDNVNKIEDDGIERPCQTSDLDCIRHFFANHSHCQMAYGTVPNPLHRLQATSHLTRINLTITATDLIYKGLDNNRIEEFFINRRTDQVVLAVEFKNVEIVSKNGFFFFYRRAKEPIITKDAFKITFNSVVVTATIPGVHYLRYDRAEHFGFSNDLAFVVVVGPNAFKNKDPVVQRTFVELLANPPVHVQENLLTEAPFYLATFVQHTLCDFGLKVL